MFDKLYPRTNPRANLRTIACYALDLQYFVCDYAICIEIINFSLKVLLCMRSLFPCVLETRAYQAAVGGERVCNIYRR